MGHRLAFLTVIASLSLVACQPQEEAPPEISVVTFTATDYAFSGPQTMPAGMTTIQVANAGAEPHHAILARVEEGRTVADMLAFYAEQTNVDPEWATFVGGVSVIPPGDTTASTAMLEAGTYVFLCFVPSGDGVEHFKKGMATQFTVEAHEGAMAAAPEAHVELRMNDYSYVLSVPLTAGTHTVRVINDGPQVHEIQLVRLQDGMTMADVQAFFAGGGAGPPPVDFLGGSGGLGVGQENYITVTLESGTYLLLCFVPDVEDAMPHVAHGMVMPIEIT